MVAVLHSLIKGLSQQPGCPNRDGIRAGIVSAILIGLNSPTVQHLVLSQLPLALARTLRGSRGAERQTHGLWCDLAPVTGRLLSLTFAPHA